MLEVTLQKFHLTLFSPLSLQLLQAELLPCHLLARSTLEQHLLHLLLGGLARLQATACVYTHLPAILLLLEALAAFLKQVRPRAHLRTLLQTRMLLHRPITLKHLLPQQMQEAHQQMPSLMLFYLLCCQSRLQVDLLLLQALVLLVLV
jgi:hypothetical protein